MQILFGFQRNLSRAKFISMQPTSWKQDAVGSSSFQYQYPFYLKFEMNDRKQHVKRTNLVN